jgi:dsDNA-binding SOS-regulon protein
MLVTFNSSTSGQLLMFAEVAHRLFAILGKAGTARGVFTAEQLPPAIAQLKEAVSEERASGKPDAKAQGKNDDLEDEEKNATIGLAQRAYPLIELMERTSKDEGFILWEAAGDF